MIVKGFVPFPGIRSFAIMRNLAVMPIAAISMGRGVAGSNGTAPGAARPSYVTTFTRSGQADGGVSGDGEGRGGRKEPAAAKAAPNRATMSHRELSRPADWASRPMAGGPARLAK